MSTIPQWVNYALSSPVLQPNQMTLNRRQVFLMYDRDGNITEVNDFTEYVPYNQPREHLYSDYTHYRQLEHQSQSKLLNFNSPAKISEFSTRSVKQPSVMWTSKRQTETRSLSTQEAPSRINYNLPSVPKAPLPPEILTPPPISKLPSPTLRKIPTLRDIHKQSTGTNRHRSSQEPASKKDSIKKPDGLGLSSKVFKPVLRQSPQTKVISPKAAQKKPRIPDPPALIPDLGVERKSPNKRISYHLPFAFSRQGSLKSDDDTYSRLYVPSTHYPEIKKPTDVTYNKLREVIAEKAAEVDSGRKQPYISELHRELLSKVPKASPSA
ncbi:hypothetical protein GJ496_008966 [Pomphorhynchus laevis]|nr:hypothetical protein GJ496_008966 [Pomphorhynchus laevis]